MKKSTKLFALFISILLVADAVACGDSLFRVGKGVSYRAYTAPLPGSVLVYGEGENTKLLAQELARSGHGVRLVSNDDELRAEMGSGNYDVVIAAFRDQQAVNSITDTAEKSPKFLPVAMDTGEEVLARLKYERVMTAEKDEIKHYLKAIHQILKQ